MESLYIWQTGEIRLPFIRVQFFTNFYQWCVETIVTNTKILWKTPKHNHLLSPQAFSIIMNSATVKQILQVSIQSACFFLAFSASSFLSVVELSFSPLDSSETRSTTSICNKSTILRPFFFLTKFSRNWEEKENELYFNFRNFCIDLID